MNKEKEPQRNSMRHTFFTILGTILCIILLPILILNISLIVKSYLHSDEVPSIGGYLPLIVLTDSMYPEIQSGDLIICHSEEPENIKKGDVIAFFDPAGNGTSVVTHSVAKITEKDGQTAWITRGIANNTDDSTPVPADHLLGVYLRRIPGLGNVVMFLQSTAGLVLCVICPILLLVGWDILRRRRYEKKKQADTEELLRELEELRKLKGEE